MITSKLPWLSDTTVVSRGPSKATNPELFPWVSFRFQGLGQVCRQKCNWELYGCSQTQILIIPYPLRWHTVMRRTEWVPGKHTLMKLELACEGIALPLPMERMSVVLRTCQGQDFRTLTAAVKPSWCLSCTTSQGVFQDNILTQAGASQADSRGQAPTRSLHAGCMWIDIRVDKQWNRNKVMSRSSEVYSEQGWCLMRAGYMTAMRLMGTVFNFYCFSFTLFWDKI